MASTAQLQDEIEQKLRATLPEVEVLLAELPSPGRLRVYIDRPDGTVDLDLCQRVSRELSALRERYALEVSSPGVERPLVRPSHFRRAVGSRITVRTSEPLNGRRSFSGGLLSADEDGIELDQDGTRVRIAYQAIRRSHLAEERGGGMR